jgi:hypothetical protein
MIRLFPEPAMELQRERQSFQRSQRTQRAPKGNYDESAFGRHYAKRLPTIGSILLQLAALVVDSIKKV